MLHPHSTNALVRLHDPAFADDLIDLRLLNPCADGCAVRNNKLLHAEIDERKENHRADKTSYHHRVVKAGQRCNGSVVECCPQSFQSIDIHQQEIPKMVKQRIENESNKTKY